MHLETTVVSQHPRGFHSQIILVDYLLKPADNQVCEFWHFRSSKCEEVTIFGILDFWPPGGLRRPSEDQAGRVHRVQVGPNPLVRNLQLIKTVGPKFRDREVRPVQERKPQTADPPPPVTSSMGRSNSRLPTLIGSGSLWFQAEVFPCPAQGCQGLNLEHFACSTT